MTKPNTEPGTEPDTVASPALSAAAGVSATTTAGSVATVKAFLDALGRLDTDAALALLAEDVVYQNVSLPKANGKAAVAKQLGLFGRYCKGFEAINHRIVGDGDTVLTERTDIIEIGRVRSEFWVCGTFEVRDGKIVLWRDYFDWANIIAGTAKGAGRALVGLAKSLRR
jgi:limonene-1,2-epoxide hydrolase